MPSAARTSTNVATAVASLSTMTCGSAGRAAVGAREVRVPGAAGRELLAHARRFEQRGAEVGGDAVPVGLAAPFGLDLELADGHALDRERAGAPHALCVHPEHGDLEGQQPQEVRGDEGDTTRSRLDREHAVERVDVRMARRRAGGEHSRRVERPAGTATKLDAHRRATSRSTRLDFHSLHAVGPVASESATVSAASRSSVSSLPAASATVAMVAGSSRSRPVAKLGSSR